jgi:hypothetical protein
LDTNPSSEANLVWDKSFGTVPNTPITGICADGVSRAYIRVKGNIPNNTIQSVNITLSDKTSFINTNWLGKVMYASNQNNNTYNEEANTANSISVTSIIISNNNEYWFWYVAPMDFQRDNFVFADSSERKVIANITINYQNNTSEIIKYPITIVRPPLMLVHGLGGSGYFNEESTWGNFKLLTGIDKDLFKNSYAPQMYGNRSFEDNANVLLGKDPTKSSSSFQSVISTMREQGYVCNQVDYICHSMGGNMMRYITSFKDDEFRVGIAKGNIFQKNYGKGWVHKFISINTPHNGSPGADLITGMTPLLNPLTTILLDVAYAKSESIQTFLNLTGYSPNENRNLYEATPAVKNLSTNKLTGGVIFKSQTLPSHLIASDYYTGSNYSILIPVSLSTNMIGFTKSIIADLFLPVANSLIIPTGLSNSNTPFANFIKQNRLSLAFDWSLSKGTFGDISALNSTFVKWGNYNQKYPEQMWNSDLVVPTMSQTANLPLSSPKVTLIQNDDTFDFKMFHIGIQDSPKVSDRVKFLLNQEVSSSYFGNIPANNNIQTSAVSNNLNKPLNSINTITYIDTRDTTKLKIITPTLNKQFDYEDVITVKSLVRDTVGLKKVELYFNGNRFVDSTKSVVSTFLTEGIKQNGFHKIVVVANYFRNDTLMLIRDTTQVIFNTTQTVSKFSITPHLKICSIGEVYKPTYNLFFGNFISDNVDLAKLNISISNTSCLSYNTQTGQFKGLQKGETVVIFTYDGIFKDTMYIAVGGGGVPYTQQISTSNVPVTGDGTICTGATISVPFTTTGGVFDVGNQYIVQLSDASGENFVSLETIGIASPLSARIPNGLSDADTYKIRVVSTSPPVIGTVAVQPLKIRNQDSIPIVSIKTGNWNDARYMVLWAYSNHYQ